MNGDGNFKVRCILESKNYTILGKIYEFINGRMRFENGDISEICLTVEDVNKQFYSKFELVEPTKLDRIASIEKQMADATKELAELKVEVEKENQESQGKILHDKILNYKNEFMKLYGKYPNCVVMSSEEKESLCDYVCKNSDYLQNDKTNLVTFHDMKVEISPKGELRVLYKEPTPTYPQWNFAEHMKDFVDGKIAVLTPTQKLFDKIVDALVSLGDRKWDKNFFNGYKDKSCIAFYTGCYCFCNIDFYIKNGYKIVEFK